jgi:hypothetical protein
MTPTNELHKITRPNGQVLPVEAGNTCARGASEKVCLPGPARSRQKTCSNARKDEERNDDES